MREIVPIVGVSLGNRHEKTAISDLERVCIPTGELLNAATRRGVLEAREGVNVEYHVRHLERHGPPSRYAKVAQRLPEIVGELGHDVVLVADITAPGRPAYTLIYQEMRLSLEGTRRRFKHCPITVTGVIGGVS